MLFKDLEKRQGIFTIPHSLLREHPGAVSKFLSNFFIYRAESIFINNSIEYHGLSYLFKEVPLGCIPIRYQIEVTYGVSIRSCLFDGKQLKPGDSYIDEIGFMKA